MSFGDDLKRFRQKAGLNIVDLKRAVGIKLFGAIVLDTPVGTSDPARQYVGGRLRANWQVSNGGDNLSQINRVDPTGAGVMAKIELVAGQANASQDLVFFNNLPYGPRIEFDGWSHTKAPKGMVRKNVVRFQRLISQEARRLRNN
jgi:hypothetical protein